MNDSTNNRNPHREFITPDNAVMLFIDHQAAIMTGVGDIDPVRFRNNVIALAKIAKLHKLPTVLSDNMPEGFAGPILPRAGENTARRAAHSPRRSDQRLGRRGVRQGGCGYGSPQARHRRLHDRHLLDVSGALGTASRL